MKKLLVVVSLLPTIAMGNPDTVRRISRTAHNLAEVTPVFIVPRMGTTVTLPCIIKEAFPGSNDFTYQISAVDPKRIFIQVKSARSKPTTIHIFCEKSSVNLDLIANGAINQDHLIVESLFGAPEFSTNESVSTEKLHHVNQGKTKGLLFSLPIGEKETKKVGDS